MAPPNSLLGLFWLITDGAGTHIGINDSPQPEDEVARSKEEDSDDATQDEDQSLGKVFIVNLPQSGDQ